MTLSAAQPRGDLLRFGLPSKGRLQAQVATYLAKAGLTLEKSSVDREYAGELLGLEGVELVFLQAGEIPGKLAAGAIHLGVTGEDLIREKTPSWRRQIHLAQALGFGRADLVVAAPKCWIDVATTDDLDDVAADFRERHGHPLRIATKYARLARAFFREKGVANYRLVDSQGATEGVVAAGAAEAIVDITSTGETLRANHLKVLEDGLILRSEAHLCASLTALWGGGALEALRGLLDRVGGAAAAPQTVTVSARIERGDLDRAEAALERVGATFLQRPLKGFPGKATLSTPADKLGFAVDILTASGAASIETAQDVAATVASTSSHYERFLDRLGAQEG
ncbi:MAG: ATP phosphoribosyltransferase [Pseudomonadota bacterium]